MKILFIILLISVLGFSIYSFIPTFILKYKFKNHKILSKDNNKNILLTFDDGPSNKYTNTLLDLLKKHEVKAIFFVVGDFANKNRDIMNRMKNEGHVIGLHSYKHKSSLFRGYRYVKEDFEKSIALMRTLNIDVTYYRPPWGQLNLFTLYFAKKYGLEIMLWNVMVGDWSASSTPNIIINRLKSQIKDGSIICLHDGRGKENAPMKTIAALKEMIPYLKSQGYNFIR